MTPAVGARTLLVLGDRSLAPSFQRALGAEWRVFVVADGHEALIFLAGILADVIAVDLDALAAAGAFVVARERERHLAAVPIIGIGGREPPPFVVRTLARPLSDDAIRAVIAAVI